MIGYRGGGPENPAETGRDRQNRPPNRESNAVRQVFTGLQIERSSAI
jgi:hypothetical protein